MLLRYFYDDNLAQASYMVGCQASGEAIVIDPARAITPYLRAAEAEGLRITHVAETHIHADYVSGTRELAHATGATMLLSDEGTADWKYAIAGENTVLLKDGDTWMVGNVRFQALHTPGHTPEHMTYMLTDTAAADEPMGLFTGDFLFVGDVGRPDLLEEAAGIADTARPGAVQQYANIVAFRDMPDYLQVWPGRGAGSACGKALGAVPSSTLGYEKRFNPAFGFDDEDAFVTWLLSDQPAAPRYFAQMKQVNKLGPALLETLTVPGPLDPADLGPMLESGHIVIDTRPGDAFAAGHIPGTLSVPATDSTFNTYVGWFVDFDSPVAFIAGEGSWPQILKQARAIGVDNIAGTFPLSVVEDNPDRIERIDAPALAETLSNVRVIDVRGADEFTSGHIAGAWNIPVGWLPRHIDELKANQPLVVHCASGYRSGIAASLLKRYDIEAIDFHGGFEAWRAADLPIER
ncbi:MAG: rhodanese-like domain-containing protein [Anaerolineae bacterium]